MTDYQLTTDDYAIADSIFREAIESNLAEEENYEAVRRAFREDAAKAWQEGSFKVEVERLVVDHLWQRVNNRAGSATTKFLRDVANGQTAMDLDDWLDTPITVGKHRRTTIRHYNMVDNDRAHAERAANLKQQQKAFEVATEATDRLRAALTNYGDIPGWVEADPDALHFGDADDSAESAA